MYRVLPHGCWGCCFAGISGFRRDQGRLEGRLLCKVTIAHCSVMPQPIKVVECRCRAPVSREGRTYILRHEHNDLCHGT